MKQKVEYFGNFNDWKGFVGLYFSKKELRVIAKEIGVKTKDVENLSISQVYKMYNN